MKELVQDIVSRLNISDRQATSGAAILFKAARDKLGARPFNDMLGKVAGIDALIAQAPPAGGVGKLFGGFASALGGNAALITTIVSGFSRLGLNADDARKFVPVILDHLRDKVGKDVVDKLEQTLRS